MREVDQALRKFVSDFNVVVEKTATARSDRKYQNYFDLMEREGRIMNPAPYTAAEEKDLLKAFGKVMNSPAIQRCFYNSQAAALETKLGYAEGYVLNPTLPVPIEHAWNLLPSGKVVDLTLRDMGEKDTCEPKKLLARARKNQQNAYFGLQFPADEIRKSWIKTGMSTMMLENRAILERIFNLGYPASWRSPALGAKDVKKKARNPEEEWLQEQEREGAPADATRSPFEGDIPPWAQAGYAGKFPLAGKVFYITAYIGYGKKPKVKPVKTPTLGEAFPVRDVGEMPRDVSFGSLFMFHPFAAIPVRMEDRDDADHVVDYLVSLIDRLGVFGKILVEEKFPSGQTVILPGGRWFPVDESFVEYEGIGFWNAYSVNRLYGGPEEGGWWYDAGIPVASVPIIMGEDSDKWRDYLSEKVAWFSHYPVTSVLGHDTFGMELETGFAREYPQERPRYS